MRSETVGEGNRVFSPDELLSPQQIKSFFGNLCLKKQRVFNIVKGEESAENDEDLQNVINDFVAIERSQVLSSIVSELTHS